MPSLLRINSHTVQPILLKGKNQEFKNIHRYMCPSGQFENISSSQKETSYTLAAPSPQAPAQPQANTNLLAVSADQPA